MLVAVLLTVMSLASCSSNKESASAEATRMLEEVSDQKDDQRLLTLADSLLKVGMMKADESYFWQGFAHYRMQQRSLAEFYWQESISVVEESAETEDLSYYAKSASFLVGQLYRFGEFATALQTALPVLRRLEKKGCDNTTDYNNLLIFTACCKLYFDPQDSTALGMFDRAYQMHNEHIQQKGDIDTYHDAVAGLINIAYSWNYVKNYEQTLVWTERLAQLITEYKDRFDDEGYVDKQWGRYKIYRAIALEGLDRHDEAEQTYREFLQTRFSQSMEGLTHTSDFLSDAKRWDEALETYQNVSEYLFNNNAMYSLDNVQRYLLKKYRANLMLNNPDSVNATARQICEVLDSAITHSRKIDAYGLQAIHKKDTEIMEREKRSAELRQINFIIIFLVIIISFTIYTIYRHRIQRHLAEYNAQLEKKNELLTEANARAEESAKMKTNFIQQISHEIRTPLNILSGFTQIVTTPGMELDDETKQDINRQIIENTERITGLVNKMLELSDVNSQTTLDRSDQVPAIQIAAQAAEASGITTAQHLTFDLQVMPEAESAMLQTNLAAATRALTLLLDNARKFTLPPEAQQSPEQTDKKEKVVLRVTLEGEQVLFIVEDTGIGIPAEEADRIFEEFVQLNDYYDGTGIGLTVARSMARRLGGDIFLDTNCTAATRFVMHLPS